MAPNNRVNSDLQELRRFAMQFLEAGYTKCYVAIGNSL